VSTNPEYASYILDQISMSGEITDRKMFGGVGIYVDGAAF
jgi:TfoX/Sxy family transcriptional regulator of competence genes